MRKINKTQRKRRKEEEGKSAENSGNRKPEHFGRIFLNCLNNDCQVFIKNIYIFNFLLTIQTNIRYFEQNVRYY